MLSLGRYYFRFRLMILCVACAGPSMGLIIYEISNGIDQSIDATRLEIAGNAYQRPLERLLEEIPLYGLSIATDGKIGGAPAPAIKGEVDGAFKELAIVQKQFGEGLRVTETPLRRRTRSQTLTSTPPLPSAIQKQWEDLNANAGRLSTDAWNQRVDDLTATIRRLIVHVGNTSTLILDVDLDTYYLMDMTLCKMPQTQDRLSSILRREGEIIPNVPFNETIRQELAIDAAMLEEIDSAGILTDVQTCLLEDPNFHGTSPSLQKNLPAAIQPYLVRNENLISSLKSLAQNNLLPHPEELLSRTERLRAQSFEVWDKAVVELDILLDKRIDDLVYQRLFFIFLTLVILAAASLLAWAGLRVENLREANERLEQKVVERTRELEAAYQELETFSYSVSHDLRSPLRGINSSCALLINRHGGGLEPEVRSFLDRIDAASQRMGQIIDDLLQLSRVARSKLVFQPIDLSALAMRIASDLRTAAPHRIVTFDIASGLSCQADYRLMQNVLENLLENAWKYTSRKPMAQITFNAVEKEGQRIFRVKDNGAGFDMRFVQKLFQSFQRLHTQTEFEGTGIGLAIVARIIHRHGGQVWAEGVEGEGASFYFTLGTKREPEQNPQEAPDGSYS